MIAERDLQRGIDRFGTRICKKAVVDSGRRHVGDLSREFDRLVVGDLKRHAIVEFGDLVLYGLDNLWMAVTHTRRPQPGVHVIEF